MDMPEHRRCQPGRRQYAADLHTIDEAVILHAEIAPSHEGDQVELRARRQPNQRRRQPDHQPGRQCVTDQQEAGERRDGEEPHRHQRRPEAVEQDASDNPPTHHRKARKAGVKCRRHRIETTVGEQRHQIGDDTGHPEGDRRKHQQHRPEASITQRLAARRAGQRRRAIGWRRCIAEQPGDQRQRQHDHRTPEQQIGSLPVAHRDHRCHCRWSQHRGNAGAEQRQAQRRAARLVEPAADAARPSHLPGTRAQQRHQHPAGIPAIQAGRDERQRHQPDAKPEHGQQRHRPRAKSIDRCSPQPGHRQHAEHLHGKAPLDCLAAPARGRRHRLQEHAERIKGQRRDGKSSADGAADDDRPAAPEFCLCTHPATPVVPHPCNRHRHRRAAMRPATAKTPPCGQRRQPDDRRAATRYP